MTQHCDRLAALPFDALIAEARNGSDLAANIIVERYQPHVLHVIRRKMHRDMRQKFDSQDFLQAVWKSFFSNREELLEASDPRQLIGYLAAMAKNKLLDETRRQKNTQKRDLSREQPLHPDGRDTHAGREDTPSQVVMAQEALDRLIEGTSDRDRQIVLLKVNGEHINEIAKKFSVSSRTVRRVLARLEDGSGE